MLHIQRWPRCNIRSEWLPHIGQEREKNFLISDRKSLDVRSPTSSPGGLIIAVQYSTWPRSRWTFQLTQSCSSFHCTVCTVCTVWWSSGFLILEILLLSYNTLMAFNITLIFRAATSMKASADCKSVDFSKSYQGSLSNKLQEGRVCPWIFHCSLYVVAAQKIRKLPPSGASKWPNLCQSTLDWSSMEMQELDLEEGKKRSNLLNTHLTPPAL